MQGSGVGGGIEEIHLHGPTPSAPRVRLFTGPFDTTIHKVKSLQTVWPFRILYFVAAGTCPHCEIASFH